MQTKSYLLAIDQGTTSSRAIIFNKQGQIIASAQQELPQHYPQSGWVEHDAAQIWQDVQTVIQNVIQKANIDPNEIAAAGITNQRETTVIWERATGKPLHNAIVWQDRRTSDWCRAHHSEAVEKMLRDKTGLVLDPYFSATKIAWILDHIPNARQRAERGELAFGTIETWLLWNLTNGASHQTDASNAARTLLYNIHEGDWDEYLLNFFNIPKNILPKVVDCSGNMGIMDVKIGGAPIPICGMAGDQQAATFGQACFQTGMLKSTYGTGCFMVLNTGETAVTSQNRLLTTVAWRLNGKTTFALEGSIFVAGAAVQWLRDAVKLINNAGDSEMWARNTHDTGGVYLVPAFTGLGAPYWDPDARGAILGLSRDSGIGHIVKAALEAVCYQTRDLLNAMREDGVNLQELRVDGGMVVNNWLTQALADVLQLPVIRPKIVETTALGAAFLAGLGAGVYADLAEIAALWQTEHAFQPEMSPDVAEARYAGWQKAVARVRS